MTVCDDITIRGPRLELTAEQQAHKQTTRVLTERVRELEKALKHSRDVFDAIDMTGLCPLCQGDEDHNSECPMLAVEEEAQAALAAT